MNKTGTISFALSILPLFISAAHAIVIPPETCAELIQNLNSLEDSIRKKYESTPGLSGGHLSKSKTVFYAYNAEIIHNRARGPVYAANPEISAELAKLSEQKKKNEKTSDSYNARAGRLTSKDQKELAALANELDALSRRENQIYKAVNEAVASTCKLPSTPDFSK